MRSVLRLLLIAVLGYAIVTADPAQKAAMWNGARAFVSSVRDACVRTEPCGRGLGYVRDLGSNMRDQLASSYGERTRPVLER